MANTFNALFVDTVDGAVVPSLRRIATDALPSGEVTVAVDYSTVNYKDGLVLNGLGKIVRAYPHIPGIDLAGTVESSEVPDYRPGDKVLLTGWQVGELYWGGYAQKARVKAAWLVPLPPGLTTRRAMAIGTAGFTAMLAVMALEESGLTPETAGEVLVTGAAGGLGSIAVAVLHKLGYTVAASTGRADSADYLRQLGASVIIPRAELAEPPKRPLLSERWAGCVDAVGGAPLSTVIAAMRSRGAIAACGNAAGIEFTTNILPFILRGVRLLGIDSVLCPLALRQQAWARLVDDLPMDLLDDMTTQIGLTDIPEQAGHILKGQVQGRLVVDVNT